MGYRYLKFALNGLLGTAIETLVLWLFAGFVFQNYVGDYIIAPIIAFEIELIFKFIISYYWIWNKNRTTIQGDKPLISHFIPYNFFFTFGFLVRMALLLAFEKIFGWDVVICNLAAILLSGSLNFLFAEKIVFKGIGLNQLLSQSYQWIQKKIRLRSRTIS